MIILVVIKSTFLVEMCKKNLIVMSQTNSLWKNFLCKYWLHRLWYFKFVRNYRVIPSVLWHSWLGVRKSILRVKIEWWCVGVVICLEWVHIVCICSRWCHCIPKPDHLLPHLNPDWFYLSGTGLPRLSWKRGRSMDVVVVDSFLCWHYFR